MENVPLYQYQTCHEIQQSKQHVLIKHLAPK